MYENFRKQKWLKNTWNLNYLALNTCTIFNTSYTQFMSWKICQYTNEYSYIL